MREKRLAAMDETKPLGDGAHLLISNNEKGVVVADCALYPEHTITKAGHKIVYKNCTLTYIIY